MNKYNEYECILVQPPRRVQAEIKGKIDISFWFYKPWRKWLKDSLEKKENTNKLQI